jgi:Mn-dependent DtxR family transcriptional regulator
MALSAEQLYVNRCGEILGLVKSEPSWSNKELAERLGLSYRVVQATTARMEKENLILGKVIGAGMYTKIEWRRKK